MRKKMKKLISLIVICVLAVSLCGYASGMEETDDSDAMTVMVYGDGGSKGTAPYVAEIFTLSDDTQFGGWGRKDYENVKLAGVGMFGRKYEKDRVRVSLKFAYYLRESIKEDVDFSDKAYLLFSGEKKDGSVWEELREIDVSGEVFQMERYKYDGAPAGEVECTPDIPFEDMDDTGKIEVASALWYGKFGDGTYELLILSNTQINSHNWQDALYPAEEDDVYWDGYKTCFYYIKTPDGVLIYKKPTLLIRARLFFVEKMRGFTLYREEDDA